MTTTLTTAGTTSGATTGTTSPAPVAEQAFLPVHPRRGGWRTGAASALLSFAVSELRAGRDPHRDVLALARLGQDAVPGLAAAQEIDRRLVAALAPLTDDLLLHRARAAAFDGPAAPTAVLPDELADVVVATLFDALEPAALVGRPHPGEWVASSVDVVPCAVHGYEDGPVDCLRRSVRSHLAAVVDRVAGATVVPGAGALAEAVGAAPVADHPEDGHPDEAAGTEQDHVVRVLWTGVAALAAWQAHAAAA